MTRRRISAANNHRRAPRFAAHLPESSLRLNSRPRTGATPRMRQRAIGNIEPGHVFRFSRTGHVHRIAVVGADILKRGVCSRSIK